MGLKIERTNDWEVNRVWAIWPSVLACVRRFINEFPDEASEQQILEDVLSGAKQLWVVYDEEQPATVLMAVLTESKQIAATGVSYTEIVGIGGERVREALPLLNEIERWAEQQGDRMAMIIGRFGWIPMLKELGYEKKAVILKKPLGEKTNAHA